MCYVRDNVAKLAQDGDLRISSDDLVLAAQAREFGLPSDRADTERVTDQIVWEIKNGHKLHRFKAPAPVRRG